MAVECLFRMETLWVDDGWPYVLRFRMLQGRGSEMPESGLRGALGGLKIL